MNISEICIKRPVLATVINLILIVLGIVGYQYLSVSFLPVKAENSIMVTSNYPGASAQLVESSVTTPLEQAISSVGGIDSMSSESNAGISTITVRLLPNFDIYELANKIRNAVAMTSYLLPTQVKPPTVQAGHGSADLMDIGISASDRNLSELRDYAERFILNKIQQIPGVSGAYVEGANVLAMRIWLNPEKMAALNLSVEDIVSAVQNSNMQLAAGQVKGNSINYPITAATKLQTVSDFSNIILKKNNDAVIRIKDIANVAVGTDNQEPTYVKINGKAGIFITVYNEEGANPIKISDSVLKLLTEIKHQLPPSIKMTICYNQAEYMKSSVSEVYTTIFFAIASVTLVIFLFLGSLRASLIPLATIPICLIATFGLIYLFNFSINIITLLALVLSIGIIVDDAIVVLENIHRHIEHGQKPFAAAIFGSRQIIFPVIAMTLTLAAVYAPIGLTSGKAANIFAAFAFTLAGAVIISGFTALTLSPMMCARLLTTQVTNSYTRWLDNFFEKLKKYYQSILEQILSKRFKIFGGCFILAFLGYFLFTSIPKAFMPNDDRGFLITIIPITPGMNGNFSQEQINQASQLIKKMPGVRTIASLTGGGDSRNVNVIFTQLKPYGMRSLTGDEIAKRLNLTLKKHPLLNNSSTFSPLLSGSMKSQLEFYLRGSGSYLELYASAKKLVSQLKKYPGLTNIESDLKFDSQQYRLTVNRELAGNLGVDVRTINNAMANLMGGNAVSSYDVGGKSYDVYIQADDRYLHSLNSINKFYVKSAAGNLIPLSNLVQINPVLEQNSLQHFDRLRAAVISAQLSPDYTLGDAVSYLQKNLPSLLPFTIKYAFKDSARQLVEASQNSNVIFVFAFIFIYLVLCAQFESFLDPLIILLSVPFSIIGAVTALKLFGGSINIFTTIGLVSLIGLVAKHGILITQFANQLQAEGESAHNALIKAAAIRLRPILMTTAAMIVGALPLLLAHGASGASRQELGLVITSGLFFGTFFSLILVPVSYIYMSQFKVWLRFFANKLKPIDS